MSAEVAISREYFFECRSPRISIAIAWASVGPNKISAPISRARIFLVLTNAVHGIVVNGMRDLMAESARQLLSVLYEIEKSIGDVDVAAGHRERIWLSLVDQDEFEWVLVARLRNPKDRGRERV